MGYILLLEEDILVQNKVQKYGIFKKQSTTDEKESKMR